MKRSRAALLRHRQDGAAHLDLILADGAWCAALTLARHHGRLTAGWRPAHRRRYLAYRGPVSASRGSLSHLWNGTAFWWRVGSDAHVRLEGLGTLRIHGQRVVHRPRWLRLGP
jgi:hypothetical protein